MHLVFTTIGSMGDLNPILAVALEWTRRGHRSTVVSIPSHRARVESVGLPFYATLDFSATSFPGGNPSATATPLPTPDPIDESQREELLRKTHDIRRGTRVLYEEIILPTVAASYTDLRRVIETERPDGLVANDLALAVPVAAEVYGLPWAAAVLQPGSFLSAHDPPASPAAPWLRPLGRVSPRVARRAYRLLGWTVYTWHVHQLRQTLGLQTMGKPLLREKYAADVALALFSAALTQRQPDWPVSTVQCGFPFLAALPTPWEGAEPELTRNLPEGLERFLNAGPPPIVFTLGDTASETGSDFFEPSLRAARALGARAVLVTGRADPSLFPTALSEDQDVHLASYVPYGPLFERAQAVVHAGGIGTIGLALRAGVPQLIVPHLHDQPDNAARAARTGAALTLRPGNYTAERVAARLRKLLTRPSYPDAARRISDVVKAEPGAATACDALEAMVNDSARTKSWAPD